MEVRGLSDSAFGLIHSKAGVVRRADGTATAFLGSANEILSAWKLNHELLWEDDAPENIAWVQEEFHALWNDTQALVSQGLLVRGLSEAVNQLLSRRDTCVIIDEAHRARLRNMPKVDANARIDSERARKAALADMFKALGGGWETPL